MDATMDTRGGGQIEPITKAKATGAVSDPIFIALLWASGIFVLLLLGLIIAQLFMGGLPALQHFGLDFIWTANWNPVTENYGALVMIYGTLFSAVIAVVVALPLSFGIAFFLTEICPQAFKRPIGVAVQLLAAVPSIIYGMWGFFVIVPLMAAYVQPPLIETLGQVPILGLLFSGPPLGSGMLTAGLILAVMILPFITAMFVETLESVPPMLKESAYGVGGTTYEVYKNVSIPYGRTAMVGAIMLGLGRALGETMAVTFVIGNATRLSASLFAPGATIASTIANEFPEAPIGSLKLTSLLQLGFILFVISFIVLALSRALVRSRLD
ncbi:phosphate ABC transporter permease subunit PstC [Xanthobacter tagetidis]|jgi:phosphate transport system permease protein|uniref:Phosphate transport system permease protein n=1 Tax=Xanthobacter tagetidis TaxID=60216 RepID=A0A3L7AIR3_9HYPH|nr:phosphate ABC transporter permease subunit PstC [Xanthobacter tagetidis]MBB6306808.1 phosphate transport system permease protein [Xanthobacter tagetidis]RLP80117.1 phosphate ABC transporter permease subunit PstC [Xanthobacter tagetidis]